MAEFRCNFFSFFFNLKQEKVAIHCFFKLQFWGKSMFYIKSLYFKLLYPYFKLLYPYFISTTNNKSYNFYCLFKLFWLIRGDSDVKMTLKKRKEKVKNLIPKKFHLRILCSLNFNQFGSCNPKIIALFYLFVIIVSLENLFMRLKKLIKTLKGHYLRKEKMCNKFHIKQGGGEKYRCYS